MENWVITRNTHEPLISEKTAASIIQSHEKGLRNTPFRWDKNDTKDSANVADLVSQGKCHFYDLPELRLRGLRSLLMLRKQLKKQLHGCRVRIRNNLVAQYFPELDLFWNIAEAENMAIVGGFLDPVRRRPAAATSSASYLGGGRTVDCLPPGAGDTVGGRGDG